jgi:hypothetical protein
MKMNPRRARSCVALSFLATLAAVLLSTRPAFAGDEKSNAPGNVTGGNAAAATTESQREASAILAAMGKYLAGLQSFTCSVRAGYDVVQSTGQKIEFGETRRVTMDRPNRLRVEEVSSDGASDLALFDGRNVTVFNADAGVFARAPQPGSVDDALVYFVRDLRMRMPLALLMTTRLPSELAQRVKSVDFVEDTDIDGVPVHHIAGRTDSTDFQFWITAGEHALPLRIVLTYRESPGEPQFWANFADWRINPKLAKGTFEFTPPKGARQIAFAVQVPRPGDTPRPPGANGEVKP